MVYLKNSAPKIQKSAKNGLKGTGR